MPDNTSDYSYPPGLKTDGIPYILFKARPYVALNDRLNEDRGRSDPGQETEFRIALPPQLTSSDSFNYESTSLLKTEALANLVNGDIGDSIEGALAAALQGVGFDGMLQAGQALFGRSLNPKEELLFKNPTLRSHTFTFNLFARTESEAQRIVNIIRKLRKIAYPTTTELPLSEGNATFFEFPYQFSISQHPLPTGGVAGNGFPPIPAAVCTSIETNFAGGGRTVVTKGNYFQAIDLTLSFQDIRVMTSDKISAAIERD